MNKEQFLEYMREHFTLDGTSQRLISGIVDFVCAQSENDEDNWYLLYALLSPIGIELDEVKQLTFKEC